MPTADPVSVGYALLYNTLAGDATFIGYLSAGAASIFQVMAPPSAPPAPGSPPSPAPAPYALLNYQSGQDVLSATATRVLATLLFQVKLVGPAATAATLRAAYARADALLMPGGQPLRNAGGTLALYREQPLAIGELVNGVLWLNYGGLYRVEI